MPHFVENGLGVGPDFFVDKRKGCCLGPTSIFYRGTDHAACIGDEIGQHEDTAAGEYLFGLCRERDVGALSDDPGLQSRNIAGMDDIGPRRGGFRSRMGCRSLRLLRTCGRMDNH